MEETNICIYCGKQKSLSSFNEEHIVPQSLTKKLLPDLFVTHRVCSKCNGDLGRYVDAKFSKSYFYKNDCALASYEYLDIEKTTYAPLIFWGEIENINVGDGFICDLWGSPCGGRILHVHKKEDDVFYDYAGGDPVLNNREPGKVIFINVAKDSKRILLGIRSFRNYFRKSERFVANIVFSDKKGYEYFGKELSEDTTKIVSDFFISCPNKDGGQLIQPKFSISKNFDKRFLAKIGIGIGFNLFGEEYLTSPSYKNLYNLLWRIDCVDKDFFIMHYLKDNHFHLPEDFSWKGGIVISFHLIDNRLFLFMNIYEHLMGIELNRDLNKYSKQIIKEYINNIYIVVPIIDKLVIVPYYEFLLYKNGDFFNTDLNELDKLRTDYRPFN